MKYFLIILTLSLFIMLPTPITSVAFAAFPTNNTANNELTSNAHSSATGLHNPLKVTSLQQLMTAILGFVVRIGIIIVVLMIIYIGFKFVTSQGKPEEIQKARMMLLWTIVGALIILGAQAISLGVAATVTSISAGTNQSSVQKQPTVQIQSI